MGPILATYNHDGNAPSITDFKKFYEIYFEQSLFKLHVY